MGLFNKFVFKIFFKKLAKRGIQIFVAYLASDKLIGLGVSVDPEIMTATIWGGLEGVRQLIKVNTGWSWI